MALMPSPLEERHLKINTFQSLSLHREITLGTRAEAEGPSAQVILRLEKKAVILSTEILLMHTEGRRERERERERERTVILRPVYSAQTRAFFHLHLCKSASVGSGCTIIESSTFELTT